MLPVAGEVAGAEWEVGRGYVDTGRLQYFEGFGDHFGIDSVTGDDGEIEGAGHAYSTCRNGPKRLLPVRASLLGG